MPLARHLNTGSSGETINAENVGVDEIDLVESFPSARRSVPVPNTYEKWCFDQSHRRTCSSQESRLPILRHSPCLIHSSQFCIATSNRLPPVPCLVSKGIRGQCSFDESKQQMSTPPPPPPISSLIKGCGMHAQINRQQMSILPVLEIECPKMATHPKRYKADPHSRTRVCAHARVCSILFESPVLL